MQCESTQRKVECVVHQSNMKYTEQVCFCQNKLLNEIVLIVLIHRLLHDIRIVKGNLYFLPYCFTVYSAISFYKVIITYNISSNINEVIRTALNFFFTKRFRTHQKHQKHLNQQKAQKAQKRNQAKIQKHK